MKRRDFILGLSAASLLASKPLLAAGEGYTHSNGRWDPSRKVFEWYKIGVDPYGKQPLRTALKLFNIPAANQAAILEAIEISPGVWTTPKEVATIRRGHQYAAMVSGGINSPQAWAAPNVTPFPDSSWSSTRVDVWMVSVNGQRYVFGRPHGCSNWLLLPGTNAPYYCPPPCCG